MARARRGQPRWLTREHIEAIHALQLSLHGGLRGMRDAGALESALGRAQHRWLYEKGADVPACAAAYGFGIACNHPFTDGNKRTALVAMATFLMLNGFELTAPEADAVVTMLGVATAKIPEADLAQWLRDNSGRTREALPVTRPRPTGYSII